METVEMMRRRLEWAQKSREEWRLAYMEAVEMHDSINADMAVVQMARFDRIVEIYNELLEGAQSLHLN